MPPSNFDKWRPPSREDALFGSADRMMSRRAFLKEGPAGHALRLKDQRDDQDHNADGYDDDKIS
jgi:hypothetical protein